MKSSKANPVTEPPRSVATSEVFGTPQSEIRIPELLAPAGDWDCARAAVENGADAIYFGLEKFNARIRAQNFTEADLPKLMEFLHRRGVKGYVTFNTLIFENEMATAEQYARAIIAAGVDAAIVQDVGICRLIRRLSPDFPIHASTQMTITSAAGIEFARELGCNLVVLARECSVKEIAKMVAGGSPRSTVQPPKSDASSQRSVASSKDPASGPLLTTDHGPRTTDHPSLPLEVFIHGALCVAYSGQCLTSEALGGRSANRGECAQACRMPYELVSDGRLVSLGDRKDLLSPQDLAGLELLPELVQLGVASLKIEGRLKSPEYVANITRIYREAIDRIWLELNSPRAGVSRQWSVVSSKGQAQGPQATMDHGLRTTDHAPRTTSPSYEMEMAFSRGLYTGWFRGTNNQELVHGRFGKKRGVYLGKVTKVRRDGVWVRLEGPLKPGDGVVFDAGRPEEKEEGGRVYEVRSAECGVRNGTGTRNVKCELRNAAPERATANRSSAPVVLLTFGRGDVDFGRVRAGDKVWKTSDPELERRLRKTFEGETPRFQRPISIEAHGLAGKLLTLIARDELGHVVRLDSAMPLARAEKQPLTLERLREQLGRLGGTPFKLGEMTNRLEGAVLLPIGELNRLRRELVAELELQRAQPLRWTLQCGVQNAECGMRKAKAAPALECTPRSALRTPHLNVLVRNLAQLEAALRCGVETLYCDFEDPKKYREAVSCFRHSALRTPHSAILVAPPRIFKMGEEWVLNQVRSCAADGYLLRNYDHLAYFANDRRIGDYSLNIANRLAAEYFKNRFGLERVTASYDLNFNQLEALLQASPPEWFEITIHQHMPMFHMEHCVFCAFLSSGTDYTNCGRPCDKHDLKLRDRVGAEHPVKADAGCRNTVFNALAQTGAEYVARIMGLGVRHFRLEFLNETPAQVEQTTVKYRQLLEGKITGVALWKDLKLFNQLGVTRGQMENTKP
jgi:putative protease